MSILGAESRGTIGVVEFSQQPLLKYNERIHVKEQIGFH
jgi:hypothetical protein